MRFARLLVVGLIIAIGGPLLGRDQFDEQADFNAAKKIGYQIYPQPDYFECLKNSVEPDNGKEGQTGNLGVWAFKVLQILDENNLLLTWNSKVYWLQDYPTKELADGDEVRIVDSVIFQGQKKYTAALGTSKTVRSFKITPRETQLIERAPFFREYEMVAGHTIKAEFLGYNRKESSYFVKDQNGKPHEIKLNQLKNADDKAHLKKLASKSKIESIEHK